LILGIQPPVLLEAQQRSFYTSFAKITLEADDYFRSARRGTTMLLQAKELTVPQFGNRPVIETSGARVKRLPISKF
jgi:hypothetical protein